LLATTLSKPKPLMVRVVADAGRLALLGVRTAWMVAIWTGLPLPAPLTDTDAKSGPPFRPVTPVTVISVAVADVTVPVTPSLRVIRLPPGVGSKAYPWMIRI